VFRSNDLEIQGVCLKLDTWVVCAWCAASLVRRGFFSGNATESLLLKAIRISYDVCMKTLVTLLLACCFGSAMAQSNLSECEGPVSRWNNCSGAESGPGQIFATLPSEALKKIPDVFFNTKWCEGTASNWKNCLALTKYKSTVQINSPEYIEVSRFIVSKYDEPTLINLSVTWTENLRDSEILYFRVRGKNYKSLAYIPRLRSNVSARPEILQSQVEETVARAPVEVQESRESLFLKWQAEEKSRIDRLSAPMDTNKIDAEKNTFARNELENLRAEAEQAKREKTELEAQLAAAQQQTQTKPTAPLAPQGKRVALVIGNAKYKFNPLNNPVNDATDMAASLRSVGFDVIEVKDATLKQMREATRRFADKLEVSDVGLVYYSGHGIEVKGKNYLIPVNADIRREYEVVDQAFDASNLLRMMESLQSNVKKRVNILIVDACRNNDLPKSWRSTNSGLARMDAPAGSFISFATAPGQVASDGQGRNSPYTKHLLNALKQPNVPIEQVFKEVRRNVMDETGGEQVPWENSSLIGDFYFTVKR
jgi:hypothetical protein